MRPRSRSRRSPTQIPGGSRPSRRSSGSQALRGRGARSRRDARDGRRRPSRRRRGGPAPTRSRARVTSERRRPRRPIDDGSYDFVGIVMAKSAEGDAVAEILGRRDGIEVIEQPAFWDIRATRPAVDPVRRGLRGARLRDRRLLDPARDVDPLRPDGGHRRCADAVLGSDRGDAVPDVMTGWAIARVIPMWFDPTRARDLTIGIRIAGPGAGGSRPGAADARDRRR